MRNTIVSQIGALLLLAGVTGCGSTGTVGALPAAEQPASFLGDSAMASCTSPAPRAADPDGVHGLMVWLHSTDETTKQPAILKYLAKDSNLCGASIVVLWSGVDKGPNAAQQYDFKVIEKAIQPWIAAGKIVNLLLDGTNEVGPTDTATPPWVLAQTGSNHVDLVPCPNPGSGSVGPPTPVYWEPGYSNPYRAFIHAIIRRYGTDPHVGYIRFGLGAGAEDFPQHGADGNCFPAWQKYGLSAKFWAEFSSNLTAYIAEEAQHKHATVQQMVALNPFSDPSAPYDVANAVAETAATNGVGFGTENLGSGNYGSVVEACTDSQYWCEAFQTYAGKVPLEFQPINFTLQPGTHIAPFPKLIAYAMYNHAQIFEIYPQEWLTADDPYFTTYAAHHTAWKAAFNKAARVLGHND